MTALASTIVLYIPTQHGFVLVYAGSESLPFVSFGSHCLHWHLIPLVLSTIGDLLHWRHVLSVLLQLALTITRVTATIPPAQVQALGDLYAATNGPAWRTRSNWNNGDPCLQSWFGVVCSASNTAIAYV